MENNELTEHINNVLLQAFDKVEVEHQDTGFTYITVEKNGKTASRTFTTNTMKEIISAGNGVSYIEQIKYDLLMFL